MRWRKNIFVTRTIIVIIRTTKVSVDPEHDVAENQKEFHTFVSAFCDGKRETMHCSTRTRRSRLTPKEGAVESDLMTPESRWSTPLSFDNKWFISVLHTLYTVLGNSVHVTTLRLRATCSSFSGTRHSQQKTTIFNFQKACFDLSQL